MTKNWSWIDNHILKLHTPPILTGSLSPLSLQMHTNSQSERNPSDSQGQRQDLFHTFQLFKTYSDHKFVDFKSDILSEQQTPTKQFGNNPILNLNPRATVSSLDSTKRLWTVFTSYIIRLLTRSLTSQLI